MRLTQLFLAVVATGALAQDRLKTMPGYERFERMGRETTNAFKSGALSVTWTNEGKAFDYRKEGQMVSLRYCRALCD